MACLYSVFCSHSSVLLLRCSLWHSSRVFNQLISDVKAAELWDHVWFFDGDCTVLQLHNLFPPFEKVNAATFKWLQRQHTALLLECVFVCRNSSISASLILLGESTVVNKVNYDQRVIKACAKNHLCIFASKIWSGTWARGSWVEQRSDRGQRLPPSDKAGFFCLPTQQTKWITDFKCNYRRRWIIILILQKRAFWECCSFIHRITVCQKWYRKQPKPPHCLEFAAISRDEFKFSRWLLPKKLFGGKLAHVDCIGL